MRQHLFLIETKFTRVTKDEEDIANNWIFS